MRPAKSNKLMGLDLGDQRIDIAVGFKETKMAIPKGHLNRGSLQKDIKILLELASDHNVEAFVVGMPYTLQGQIGDQAKKALRFIKELRKRTDLPVTAIDETYTSVEADGVLRDLGMKPSENKGQTDATAAALILERFMALVISDKINCPRTMIKSKRD